ncbi:MAG TPA: alpha/beta hydrolase [Spirochaetota bacterium]|nr:alpha/beta hydrolase [Spirochaetota bacterium]
MDTIVYIDPYSKCIPLKILQMIYIALVKLLVRVFSFPARASWHKTVRIALDILGTVFLQFPKRALKEKVDAAGTPARWIRWKGSDCNGVILYLHGGGYSLGSMKTHGRMAANIARRCKMKALFLEYPLAPEHKHPETLDRALAAYRWLLDSGNSPEKIAVMGDSSGGGLALAMLQTARDRGMPMPGCGVLISPWTDMACTGESMKTRACSDPMLRRRVILPFARLYAPESMLTDPSVSPLYGSMRNLPRLLIMVGRDEILLDDSRRIAGLPHDREIRVEVWKGMFHVWHLFCPYAPFFRKAFSRIGDFVTGVVE